MLVVGYPWLRAVQQGGEYDSLIDTYLSALFQMLVVPYSFVESAKSIVCLGQSVVYFPSDLGVWCDGTPQISELMNCFQLSSTDGDVGRAVLFWRAGQPLQSRKLGAAGLFWCGQWGQYHQRRGGHGTAAQVFLCGHAISWG